MVPKALWLMQRVCTRVHPTKPTKQPTQLYVCQTKSCCTACCTVELMLLSALLLPCPQVNGGGAGPVSAEWMVPKALWLLRNEPQVFEAAATICEYQDYINHKVRGADGTWQRVMY